MCGDLIQFLRVWIFRYIDPLAGPCDHAWTAREVTISGNHNERADIYLSRPFQRLVAFHGRKRGNLHATRLLIGASFSTCRRCPPYAPTVQNRLFTLTKRQSFPGQLDINQTHFDSDDQKQHRIKIDFHDFLLPRDVFSARPFYIMSSLFTEKFNLFSIFMRSGAPRRILLQSGFVPVEYRMGRRIPIGISRISRG